MSEDNRLHQTVISPPSFNPQPPGNYIRSINLFKNYSNQALLLYREIQQLLMVSFSRLLHFKNSGRITTKILPDRYPPNSLESIGNKFLRIVNQLFLETENIDDEKEECDNRDCDKNRNEIHRKTTLFYYFN